MKKLTITFYFIVFLVFPSSKLLAQQFHSYKLIYDLYGSEYSNGIIYIYGDSGHLLLSEDKGLTWQVRSIFPDDTVGIKKLSKIGNVFIGLNSRGMIFKLDENLKILDFLNIQNNTKVIDFNISNDEKIIVAYDNNIIQELDLNFKILIDFKISDSVKISKIIKLNDEIFTSTYSNVIFRYTISDSKLVTISLNEYGGNPSQLKEYMNKLMVRIQNTLYIFNDSQLRFEKINGISANLIDTDGENIFDISRTEDQDYYISYPIIKKYQNNQLIQTSINKVERYVKNTLTFNSISLYENDLLIAVGKDKTIYISIDGGLSLKLVSMIEKDSWCSKWINENNVYFISDKAQVFRSFNGGITFLPQLVTDPRLTFAASTTSSLNSQFYIDSTGNGFLLILGYQSSILDTNKMFNFLITKNFGDSYELEWIDGIKNRSTALGSTLSSTPISIQKKENKHYFQLSTSSSSSYRRNTTKFFEFDLNNKKITRKKFLDSTIFQDYYFETDKCVTLIKDSRNPNKVNINLFDSSRYYLLLSSSPVDETINTLDVDIVDFEKIVYSFAYKLDNNIFLIKVTYFNNANIDDTTTSTRIRNYLYNLKNNILYSITDDTVKWIKNVSREYEPIIIFIDKEFIYLKDKYLNIQRSKLSDLPILKWENFDLAYLPSAIGIVQKIFNDNSFYGWNRKYTSNGKFNGVDEIEKKSTNLYHYLPYPQPGTNQINVKIYTNNFNCFNPKTFEVYNSNGVIVSTENDFGIIQTGIYEADITWNCASALPGVYFIKLNCEAYNDVIKVIKN